VKAKRTVSGKYSKGNQPDGFTPAAATCAILTGRVTPTRIVRDVDGRECDAKQDHKYGPNQPSHEAHHVDMAMVLGHISGGLQHEDAEWYSRNPCVKAVGRERRQDEEGDPSSIVFPDYIVDSRAQTQDDVENPRYPNKLLCKLTSKHDVDEAESACRDKNAAEQQEGIFGEAEIIALASGLGL